MSESHASFRIRQHRLTVVVDFDGRSVEGTFACPDRGSDNPAAELRTLLGSDDRFVPFVPDGEKRSVLLNRRGIVSVRLTNPEDVSRAGESGDPRSITLVLMNDVELEGQVRVLAPIGHTRTLDYLNEAGGFVHFYAEDGGHLLINVHWILVARDRDDLT